ncbi:MAG: class I SAM-dependent rRNA methyltransferase [Clostridiales bacterium]|nr:class I SAM-dependent rRNA methyltransferase [Clostridiales bacterium]
MRRRAEITKNAEMRLKAGHSWVFRSDVAFVDASAKPGDVLDIYGIKKNFLGRGYFNPQSQITIRLLTKSNEEIDRAFFFKKLSTAWELRRKTVETSSCRVVFAESDLLPALIVDKFEDILVVQTLALGIDKFKETITDVLLEIFSPTAIFERNDAPVRELEGLPLQKGYLWRKKENDNDNDNDNNDGKITINENGIKFLVDYVNGQKTGYFLDQRENRAALRHYVSNARVLDCFSYIGSFALHAARYGASSVTGLDISSEAVRIATENASQNGFSDICRFECTNVFDKLRELAAAKETYDVIILDPPAFTKTRGALEGATRGYKEINLRAMKLLRSGGFLITCSCSQHISPSFFLEIIKDAAADTGKTVRIIESRGQAKDHPVLVSSPETNYLKCMILQVL